MFFNKKEKSEIPADIPLDVRRSMEDIYKKPEVIRLARLCKMGDMVAMMDMAEFFRSRCTEPLLYLLEQYEGEPTGQKESLIEDYLTHHSHEEKTVMGYMMWLSRAALYGNPEAENLLEPLAYYKRKPYISYDMMTGKSIRPKNVWASNFLWKAGIMDMVPDYEDCSIFFHREKGYFIFSYVNFYIPPDEYGFGAEWSEARIYFDEFFCRLTARSANEIPDELRRLEQVREEYWQESGQDALDRKYRRRICEPWTE